jgi:small subunit ribosomal protein S7
MPRNYKSTAVLLKPDPRFNSMLATKIINKIMLSGKKSCAQNIFYEAVDLAHKKFPDVVDAADIFNRAIDNIRPAVEVRSKRVGGANYQVPREVLSNRQQSLAIRWLVVIAC